MPEHGSFPCSSGLSRAPHRKGSFAGGQGACRRRPALSVSEPTPAAGWPRGFLAICQRVISPNACARCGRRRCICCPGTAASAPLSANGQTWILSLPFLGISPNFRSIPSTRAVAGRRRDRRDGNSASGLLIRRRETSGSAVCNLYSNLTAHEAMTRLFMTRPSHPPNASHPRRAVFPRNEAAIVAADGSGERELRYAHWGFLMLQVSKRTGKPILPKPVTNARSDKIRTSGFWRDSFGRRRCIVPATAYCEPVGRKPAVYHWFGVSDGKDGPGTFAFAGLWRMFHGEYRGRSVTLETFSIATTEPNPFVARFHNRMPVILQQCDYQTWLSGTAQDAFELLRPIDADRMLLIDKGIEMTSHPGSEPSHSVSD